MEPLEFRTKFKTIVYMKGVVTTSAESIKNLCRWNKNGSHERAIVIAMDKRDKNRAKLKELLGGYSYEAWLECSKKLSSYEGRLKSARTDESREKYKGLIKDLELNKL